MPRRDDYEVGYGRPPKGFRFQKGQSGNPKGRPKGGEPGDDPGAGAEGRWVVVVEHGQRKTITKFQAAMKQLVNKAASGDGKAIQFMVSLLGAGGFAEAEAEATWMQEADHAVLASLMRRFGPVEDKESSGGPPLSPSSTRCCSARI